MLLLALVFIRKFEVCLLDLELRHGEEIVMELGVSAAAFGIHLVRISTEDHFGFGGFKVNEASLLS